MCISTSSPARYVSRPAYPSIVSGSGPSAAAIPTLGSVAATRPAPRLPTNSRRVGMEHPLDQATLRVGTPRSPRHAKAQGGVAQLARSPGTARRAEAFRPIIVAAASIDVIGCAQRAGIVRIPGGFEREVVAAPLPDVAVHVVEPKTVRPLLAGCVGLLAGVGGKPGMVAQLGHVVTVA